MTVVGFAVDVSGAVVGFAADVGVGTMVEYRALNRSPQELNMSFSGRCGVWVRLALGSARRPWKFGWERCWRQT
jgi:hypothetical protein